MNLIGTDKLDIKNGKVYSHVLLLDDEIVGFSIHAYYSETNSAAIHYLGVKKEHRGKGFGKILCNQAESFYKNLDTKFIYIEVVVGFELLISYYEKMGFVMAKSEKLTLYRMEKVIN